ncbi:hypothetical protein AB0395_19265 [Streptosporangium sp. NPDC051023]|uniref:hypothetical protein n=1 Tax=Streptosporangium sp. NPDC051023 TaxID=3155410 RepID=UPI00344B591E
MDVNSPAAAGTASRPSSTPPAQQSRVTVALRRAGIALVGVGVAALTAAACVLSFEDLRALAIVGEAPPGLAYLYPAAFDALLAIALIAVLLLRGGRWPVRLQAGVVLILLFAAAVAAEVATAVRATLDVRRAAVVVAVAPWVTLLLALWLWLLLINHAAARRAAADAAAASRDHDIVPFPDADLPTAEYPVRSGDARLPVRRGSVPRQAPPADLDHLTQPVHHQPSEVVLDPQAAPPLESVPHHDLPAAAPVVGPTAAPETPEITEIPGLSEAAEPPQAPAPVTQDRPLRWGDLVRPHHGDLLVHPPRPAVREPEGRVSERVETWDASTDAQQAPQNEDGEQDERGEREEREERPEVGDRDADTQPIMVMTDAPSPAVTSRTARTPARVPDPVHEAADTEPAAGTEAEAGAEEKGAGEDTARSEADGEGADETDGRRSAAPPSGRMRSTPTPPQE